MSCFEYAVPPQRRATEDPGDGFNCEDLNILARCEASEGEICISFIGHRPIHETDSFDSSGVKNGEGARWNVVV